MLDLDLNPVAENIVRQLRSKVPVRTGRLKNSIQYRIDKGPDGYTIIIILEDYIKWLQPRRKPPTLPTPRELAMAAPPLPKMNNLKEVGTDGLSPRSKGIFDSIDLRAALDELDLNEEMIKKIILEEL